MRNPLLFLLSAFLLVGQNVWGEKVTQRVHFSFSELKVGTRTGDDGVVYSTFSYPGIGEESRPGYPTVPIKIVRVNLPHDAQNITLSQKQLAVTSHVLDQKVYPAQGESPTSLEDFEKTFCPCLSEVYDSNNQFPLEQVNITDISCAGLGDRSVGLIIYPIVYHPAENKYDFCEDVEFTITYSLPPLKARAANRANQTRDIGLPFYEYCIITNRELKDAFTRLIAWKSEKGMSAGVVCKEDILNNANIVGDTVSAIYDDAGKIRQYLQYAYASGITKYVLFGGNSQILPIRYGTGEGLAANESVAEMYHIPSDFYFSELNMNWNIDGDQHYGEPTGQSWEPQGKWDYGAELCVGRILCTNVEEIHNYTDKLLRYELNPGNGDYSYLKKALYTQCDGMQRLGLANIIAEQLHDIFPIDTIFSESPTYNDPNPTSPYGNDVIAEMNKRYSYVCFDGHGNPNGISVKSRGDNGLPAYAVVSVQANVPYWQEESANGLDNLTNKDYPMFAYSISCCITPFDKYSATYKYPNMGESFTLGKDYGGPVLVGNTRYGWYPTQTRMQEKFNEYLTIDPMVGLAHNYSFLNHQLNHYLHLSSNIIGCPNIRIWTDIPFQFNATVTYQSNHPVLSCNTPRTTAEAGARDITQVNETSTTAVFDPSTQPLAWENGGNLLITLTGINCLPQILPLKLQDVTLQGTHYAIVKDVTCGKNVRNGSQGDVVFDENADYTFETKGTIRLDKGVKVNLGAKLKVIPSEINY